MVAALAVTVCQDPGHAPPAPEALPQPEAIVQPGAPGQPSRVEARVPAFHDPAYTPADVAFMQGMIHHHMQALAMVALIPSHTGSARLRLLGEKIGLTQGDEIRMMQEWLSARARPVPTAMPDGSMMRDGRAMAPMPGMLTPQQMQALRAAHGARFDRLFLVGMIQHHTGALTMVRQLRSLPGSGLEPNIDDFLIHVVADQQMEIDRMKGLLGRPAQ